MKRSLKAIYNLPQTGSMKDHIPSGPCKACGGGECVKYSDGGKVKGVHTSSSDIDKPASGKYAKTEKKMAGSSDAGDYVRDKAEAYDEPLSSHDKKHNEQRIEKAKNEHHKVLGEMKSMPNPKLKGLAEGGEVDSKDMNEDVDNELMDMACGEFLEALHSKNKKEILDSLKAIILSVKG